MKTLSVIVPVYNCKEYLKDCVSSIISANDSAESMSIHEIILVDDGSTDGTSELCDVLAVAMRSESCVLRVIHQKNRGVSAARNEGLRVATGDFVFFVDSDDMVESDKLSKLMRSIAQDASIDMAVFGLSFDYYSGNRIYRQDTMAPPAEGKKTIDECKAMLYSLFKSNAISPLWNKLIRRSVIQRSKAFLREDMFLYEDLEFSLRILAHCSSVYFCAEPIYHYRQASDEGNAGRRLKRIAHIPELVDRIEDALAPLGGADDVLLSLYLILARERISCASREETDTVCADFKEWIDAHGLLEKIQNSEYGMTLYRRQTAKLLIRRDRTKIRHRVANAVKKTIGDFRKW